MKNLFFVICIVGIFFSCNKKGGNPESYAPDPIQDSTMIVDETTSTPAEVPLTETELNEKTVESLSKFELIENENFVLPKLELKDNLCDNLSSLKLKDLNSGGSFEFYQITKDNSASLEGFGFKGTFSDKETIIIKDYVRSKNVTCNGKTQKMGIGLRCFIHVTSKNYKAGANLPYLAANVQLGKATASYKIVSLGFGLSGDMFSNIKSSGSYDVTGFAEVEKSFDKIIGTLTNENNMEIDPVPLP